METKTNMKTYVVDMSVFCNWTCGMIVVKAKSKEEALNTIFNALDKMEVYFRCGEKDKIKENIRELKDNEVVISKR